MLSLVQLLRLLKAVVAVVQGSTTVFQAGSRTWQHLCGAGLAAMQIARIMGSCGLVPWLLKKAFETRPCVRIKFYSLSS